MEFLKEDGNLDVEKIRKLPLEEKHRVMGRFTREQVEEYFSKIPINESHEPLKIINVDYSMEDLLAQGWGTIDDIYNILMR